MEKRLYGKPLMSVEQFTPSEFVSVCWYVASGDCFDELFHDDDKNGKITLGSLDEEKTSNHPSYNHRMPSSGYYNTRPNHNNTLQYNTIESDGYYYTDHNSILNIFSSGTYKSPVSGTFYSVTIDNITHYFRNVSKSSGNPS